MEGRNRSGSHSGGVVKNRGSSGCLIIKKKADGGSGVGSSKGRKLPESKEKKRSRLNASESVSSDEELLEFYPRRGVSGMNQVSGGASFGYESNDFEDVSFGRNGLMREAGPKRSKLDVYDFDEYDDLSDAEMMRMRHYHDQGIGGEERRFIRAMPGMNNGSGLDFESGPSKGDIIYTRRNSFHGGSSSKKINGGDLYSGKRRFEMSSELPVSMGKEKLGGSDEAIRLQGKNGVLKVRVKHKEEISEQFSKKYVHVKGNNVALRSQEPASKNIVARPSPYSEKNVSKKPIAVDRLDKTQRKKRKPPESSEESDEEANDSDSSPKLQTDCVQVHRSMKRGRSGGSTESPQSAQPIKLKEGKVKRGSGTEKQLLREKIRNMLLTAGWTIDYRPRRGRDYSDAVYVNPTGTAYWSIIKAYDALQKQLEEEGNSIKVGDDCPSFAPISENVLSKLTRQTRKKMEKELKRKKREEAGGKRKKEFTSGSFEEDESDTDSGGSGRQDDKLSSFMKRSGKSLKGASKESCRDRSNSNSKMQERGEKSSSMSNSKFIHARKSKKIGRCTLLVRNSGKGLSSESDGFIPYTGKRNLLSWLIDSGTVNLSEKVHYMNRRCTRVMLEGWITREGIHCGCCSKILTVSKFEIHAGSKLRQPYQNIYLSSGASLMQCQVDAWNRQKDSLRNGYNKININGDDPNDDTCAICCDGGNLICCDSCPSTFHQSCLGIEKLPPGDWHCPHCSCKFCGLADMSVTGENNKRQDPVLTCSFCEGKYHCSCVEGMDGTLINLNSPPFCGKTCQELSEHFQKLLGVKHEMEAGLFWSLIHRTDLDSDTSVRGYPQRVEWNSKLAVALNVMDECFMPIADRRSGINMIQSVLYNSGSNIARLDYSGFYTAILEKGDEIIAAACIRIRSTQFAEMPFIGTRHIYRRQGMCRRLFSAIEAALRSLKVEKLVIPAISELMDTWTTIFGFSSLEELDKQDMKLGNVLVFPGTDMLQKKLLNQDSINRDLSGADSFETDQEASVMLGLRKKSDIDVPPGNRSVAPEPENEEMKGKPVTEVCSQDTVCTDDNSLHSAPAEFCEEAKASLPTEREEMKETSVTDFGSQEMIVDENSLHSASLDCGGEVKPSLPTSSPHDSIGKKPSLYAASAAVSIEVKPLVSNEGVIETTSSELQLDTEFIESAGDVKDHFLADASAAYNDNMPSLQNASVAVPVSDEVKPLVSDEGSLGFTAAELQLDTKFFESAGDVKVKDHIFAEASEGSFFDSSASRQNVGESADCKSTQGRNVDFAESGSPSADCTLGDTSLNGLLNGFARSDNETQRDGILYSETESAAFGKDHSLFETSHIFVVTDKPMIDPTAENNISHTPEVQADDTYTTPAETDICSGSESLHVSDNADLDAAYEPKIHVSGNPASYGKDHPSSEASHVDVVMEKPIVEPTAEDNIWHPPEVQAIDAHIVPAETDYCSGPKPLHVFDNTDRDAGHEPKIHVCGNAAAYEKYQSLSEASHVDAVMEKPVVEPTAEDNIWHPPEVQAIDAHIVSAETDICSGSESLHVSDNADLDAAHEPKIHVSGNAASYGKDHPSSEASNVDVVMEKPTVEPSAVDNGRNSPEVEVDDAQVVPAEIDICSGSQSLCVSENTNQDAEHGPKIHVMECSEIIKAFPVDDKACKSPQNTSHVSTEKPQLNSFGGINEQPSLDGEVQHVEVGNGNVQSMNKFSCEVSDNVVDANTPVSDDGGIGVTGLLHEHGI
ncbi:hypothetical protein SOVF_089350 isoform A [Spinacia oleracea]|uniref:Uncharacterized protein isoform X2 n=1 Tax=Spinacia oleracea TaxID=3562 RepID=A0A9R0K4R4_SPIOL|nr:uncharacterized protein LOC110796928 isoform X2 [Spinacia oleracea]KNA16405.1 hypothetical protein SOVF_089350 isoform A [Spinacia oleracea]